MFWQRGNSRFHANKHSFLCLTTLWLLWKIVLVSAGKEWEAGVAKWNLMWEKKNHFLSVQVFWVKFNCLHVYYQCYFTCFCGTSELSITCSCLTCFEAQRSRPLDSPALSYFTHLRITKCLSCSVSELFCAFGGAVITVCFANGEKWNFSVFSYKIPAKSSRK